MATRRQFAAAGVMLIEIPVPRETASEEEITNRDPC